jgi:hypothetical protein
MNQLIRANIRALLATTMHSVPRGCWFQAAVLQPILNKTAADVLAEAAASQGKFDAFVQALDEFRTKTKERDT